MLLCCVLGPARPSGSPPRYDGAGCLDYFTTSAETQLGPAGQLNKSLSLVGHSDIEPPTFAIQIHSAAAWYESPPPARACVYERSRPRSRHRWQNTCTDESDTAYTADATDGRQLTADSLSSQSADRAPGADQSQCAELVRDQPVKRS